MQRLGQGFQIQFHGITILNLQGTPQLLLLLRYFMHLLQILFMYICILLLFVKGGIIVAFSTQNINFTTKRV